jgi:purine-binding chemotaxis protein CheW
MNDPNVQQSSALARPLPSELDGLAPPTAARNQQYLTFILGGDRFGVGIHVIREIMEFSPLTNVPMMPPYVQGVINLRGAVVPVVNLLVRFGRPTTEVTKRTCIVITEIMTEGGRREVGILVDAVDSVLDIPATEIEPPPGFGGPVASNFIEGMGKVNGGFVILLDVECALAQEDAGPARPMSM